MPKELTAFKELAEARPQVSKKSNEELLAFLKKAMATTKEVAAFLGVENGTAFSRLRRMVKNGLVIRKWEGNRSWWVDREAVGLAYEKPEKEEAGEEE